MRHLIVLLSISTLLMSCSSSQKTVSGNDWMFKRFVRAESHNPILGPDASLDFKCPLRRQKIDWAKANVFNPAAVVRHGKVCMLFRAQDERGTSRIGLAKSSNGFDFSKKQKPVFFPDEDNMKAYEWPGGCEDPRIVQRKDGLYIMTYTAYDGHTARLCLASSKNLKTWDKHGLLLKGNKYRDHWSKSGAIVCERQGSRMVARKINGKYYMYWGDTDLFMACSEDLINWEALEDNNGDLIRVMQPRAGMFDSRLVEPGPFALLNKEGIVLIYNSANSASNGDKTLPADAYSVGQALFSKTHPEQLLARSDRYLLSPENMFEQNGSVSNVCFVEGMVWFKNHWFIYYGGGDSQIAVAECWEN